MSCGTETRGLLLGCLLLAVTATEASTPLPESYSSFAFVPNGGQFRDDVAFSARTRSAQVFVLDDGTILHALPMQSTAAGSTPAWIVVEQLPGAKAVPRGARSSDQRVTWLRSASSPPISDTRTFSALEWRDAWPGVDMLLQIVDDHTERVFQVAPGADWRRIALAYDGARFELEADGGLTARAGEGALTLSAPIAFQDTADGRVLIDVRYVVAADGARVSFEVGSYDRHLPLTIDPILQSTYFGFGGTSEVAALAVDPATGDLIAAGTSLGLGVPGTAGGFQVLHNADAGFVTRIDAKLRRVIQSTLIGGVAGDKVFAVAVHPQTGDIYVCGFSESADFPGGGGGAHPTLGGSRNDGFVARFSPDLRQLLQTTFTNQALTPVHARDLAISATTGDVYVAGEGFNPNAGYVLRFNRQLTVQLGRAVLEGNSFSRALSLALNQTTGNVYVAGGTTATEFPLTAGGVEELYRPGASGQATFIARFNAALNHLQSTYLSDVYPWTVKRHSPRIAVHAGSGELYVAGLSNRSDLPSAGGAQPAFAGGSADAVVTRLSPDLKQRRGATYFGGSAFDELTDMAFTPDGAHLYIAGLTSSSDLPKLAGGAIPAKNEPVAAFVARLPASLSTVEQTTYFTPSMSNTAGVALAVHPTTDEVYIGSECLEGIPETTGGLQPEYLGGTTPFGTGCLARLDALLSGGDDVDADAFAFTDQYAVAAGDEVTSAPVRIEGITVPVTASLSNGTFSIDDGPFDATAREVLRGQSIRVRHTAAAAAGVATDTVLSVGSRTDTFISMTASGADSTPAPLEFAARDPVAPDIEVDSDPVVVGGIDTPAAISIANGEYSIDGGAFSSAAGTINGGQTVVVRHTSAGAPARVTTTTLTIGGVSHEFKSITDALDDSVHPFAFHDEPNVPANFDAASDPVVIIGINTSVPVSVVGAEWTTDGLTYQTGPGFVENFAHIGLRMRTGAPGQTVTATLTVADQSDTWVLSQPQVGDTTPDPFSFEPQSNVEPSTYAVSNEITVTGIDVPVPIEPVGAAFLDPVSGLYLSSGFISNGQKTRIRMLTSPFDGDRTEVRVRIGTAEATFVAQNAGADGVPDPFNFIDESASEAGASVVSNPITVSGLVGPAPATVSGCELSVNGNAFSTAGTMVTNGSQVRLRLTAPAAAGATATCTLTIGGVSDQFRVTTAGASAGGNKSGRGGGGGSLDRLALLSLLLLTLIRALRCLDAERVLQPIRDTDVHARVAQGQRLLSI